MSHISITTINEEHDTLGAMLNSVRMMIQRGPAHQPELFFDIMRAMLFYIDEVPEKQHHPKETEVLFPLVAKRSPVSAELIQRLNKEHHKGEASIRDLQHKLLAWEILGDARRPAFLQRTYSLGRIGHLARGLESAQSRRLESGGRCICCQCRSTVRQQTARSNLRPLVHQDHHESAGPDWFRAGLIFSTLPSVGRCLVQTVAVSCTGCVTGVRIR